MTTASGATIDYTYNDLKQLQKTTVKNGETTLYTSAYAYKTLSGNQTTTQIEYHNVRDSGNIVIAGAKYAYDDVGNIIGIYESTDLMRQLVVYEYDVQNQLVSEQYYTYSGTATNPSKISGYEYTYDTAGNILLEYEVCSTFTFDADGNALSESRTDSLVKRYTYGDNSWRDLLTAVNGDSITYDAIGNPTTYRNGELTSDDTSVTYHMDWEHGRQLSYLEIWDDYQTRVTYDYDLDGIRTSKTVESVTHNYVTQNGKVVRETIDTGTTAKVLDFVYDAQERPFALIYTNGTAASQTYYYVLNLQGDVVGLTDADGAHIVKYSYNAWGEPVAVTDDEGAAITGTANIAHINPLRYRGYYYDSETGFYYLQSRYYDPVMHRFINADSLASTGQGILGHNMFAYCLNNPVHFLDSAGQAAIAIASAGIGLLMLCAFGATAISYSVTKVVETGREIIDSLTSSTTVKVDSLSKKIEKAEAKIRSAVTEESKIRYWSATVHPKYVDIGRPLTFAQAVHEVQAGNSVFAVTWYEAKAVAIAAGGSSGRNNRALEAEIDSGKENTPGYYYHYHTYNRSGGHVYYLFGRVTK